MDSFTIGLSGLDAAQKALDTIGNNIANAATEGYHRQRISLAPAYSSQLGSLLLGGGVDVVGVSRMIDRFLEQEILRQQSSLGQVSQEFKTLRTVETAFGELSSGSGLNATINEFFNALQDLSAHPSEMIWQSQAVMAAETMTNQFRTLGSYLTALQDEIILEAGNTIEQINVLINGIAELNHNIKSIEIGGGQANNLRDQRDRCITELSELINVQTQAGEYGVVNVSAAGIPVVTSGFTSELEVGLRNDGRLGISIAGMGSYNSDVQGGRLGGLLSLRNEFISEIHNDLNSLAFTIIQQINQYHVQGLGTEGSFSELTGWAMPSENLADFATDVTNGKMYIRVTDTSTGEITRHEIDIDVSTDSLTTIAADITAITGLTSWVSASQLHIQAGSGYEFDFLPAVLPEPTAENLTGAEQPVIAVSGIYTGTTNSTFTCTVAGVSGKIGVTDGLKLEVRKDGTLVKELNVGLGYAAGDRVDLGDGLYVSLSIDSGKTAGDLNVGDDFEVKAWADTDTSRVLAAIGMNTFFSGSSAINMAVSSDISAKPGRIATCLGGEMTDNANAFRMAGLKDESLSSLNNMSPGEFYRMLVAGIGQKISIKGIHQDNTETLLQNLANQQTEISGVNINDEAAQMLVFEQMFQAMAKFLSTVQSSISSLMEVV